MEPTFGYNGKLLHVDVSTGSKHVEQPKDDWYRIHAGGGLAGTSLLLAGTPPELDPFDPRALLIFASSVIAGLDGPGLARFSVVCKSPLTFGIGETRCEGPFGRALKACGYDALVFHGSATHPVYLLIDGNSTELRDATELWGTDTHAATQLLKNRHGEHACVAAIGAAGENLVRYASIVTECSIQAMRMGVGAVMGSKHLKAVVLVNGNTPAVADPLALSALQSSFTRRMEQNTLSMWQKSAPGFSASADLSDFDTAYIGAENYRTNLRVANSDFTRAAYLPYYKGCIACPGCPNDCIKVIDPGTGPIESAGIHQEVTGSLGPNIGNTSLALMLQANIACNLHGLDPVSLGFTISFAMECIERGALVTGDFGPLPVSFGSCGNLMGLIESIAHRTGIGDLLAEGSRRASQRIGKGSEEWAMHVKGLEMVSFEPRTQTNLALGYAVAPIGPRYDICEHDWDYDVVSGWDHTLTLSRTLGILERMPMQRVSREKVRNFKALNTLWSAFDALDLCVFAGAPTRVLSLEDIAVLIHAVSGWETSSYELMRWGERRNHLMRMYNIREGLGEESDTLPDRFFTTPIAYGRLEGTVLDKKTFMDAIKTYYAMMGWNEHGVPLEATLVDHQIAWTMDCR